MNQITLPAWEEKLKQYPYPAWIKKELGIIEIEHAFFRAMINTEICIILYKNETERQSDIKNNNGNLILGWPSGFSLEPKIDYMQAVRDIVGRK